MISAYRDEYQKFWNIQGPKGPLSHKIIINILLFLREVVT
jgi:hypothetical protein